MFLADPIGIGCYSSSYTPSSTTYLSSSYSRDSDSSGSRGMYSNGQYNSSSLARPLPVGPADRYEKCRYDYSGGSLGRSAYATTLTSSKPPIPEYRSSSSGMYRLNNTTYANHYRNPASSSWYDTSPYTSARIPRSSSVDRFRSNTLRKYEKEDEKEEDRYGSRPVSRDAVNHLTSRFDRSIGERAEPAVNHLTSRFDRSIGERAEPSSSSNQSTPLFHKRSPPIVRFGDQTCYSEYGTSTRSRIIPIHFENGTNDNSYTRTGVESRYDIESRDALSQLPKSQNGYSLYRSRDGASSMPDVPLISCLVSKDRKSAKTPSIPEISPISSSASSFSRGNKSRSSSSSQESAISNDSGYSRKSSNESKDNAGLRGLANLGNTCFMNSMLQCLSNTTPLIEYVLQSRDTNNNTSRMKGQIFKAFYDLMQQLWKRDTNGIYLNPDNLKSQIQKFAPRFSGYNQQDSQEFLRYILQGLHEDINRVEGKVTPLPPIDDSLPDEQKSDEAWMRYLRYDDSKIVELFVGQYKSELRCTHCGHVSTTFDPFWDLSLPIPAVRRAGAQVTLAECFDAFTKEEILDGNERPKCEQCNAHRRCGKRITIQRFPQILVLHLKRFSGERFRSRLSTLVDFPLKSLNLKAYASPKSSALGTVYNCYAVSNHIGTQTMGHYTAYCKHSKSGKWYLFDDSRVSPADERSIISSDAYVLFYESANVSSL